MHTILIRPLVWYGQLSEQNQIRKCLDRKDVCMWVSPTGE